MLGPLEVAAGAARGWQECLSEEALMLSWSNEVFQQEATEG